MDKELKRYEEKFGEQFPLMLCRGCDDDEIMFVIGHELGHVKSNHMLYHMMAQALQLFRKA